MQRTALHTVLGLLLTIAGALLLLHNFDLFHAAQSFVWMILFALGGASFLYVFLRDREHWWAALPGCTLLGLAAVIALTDTWAVLSGDWGGTLFLGVLGLSFWLIYLTHHEHWWAVIPGGALCSLTAVAGLSTYRPGMEVGGVLFTGLGLTFSLLALLPTPEGRMTWALIPGLALLALGAFLLTAAYHLAGYFFPVVLILGGLALLYAQRKKT